MGTCASKQSAVAAEPTEEEKRAQATEQVANVVAEIRGSSGSNTLQFKVKDAELNTEQVQQIAEAIKARDNTIETANLSFEGCIMDAPRLQMVGEAIRDKTIPNLTLGLSRCKIGLNAIQPVVETLGDLQDHLVSLTLELRVNRALGKDSALPTLFAQVSKFKRLRSLKVQLAGSNVTSASCMAIVDALATMPWLQSLELDLSFNPIDDEAGCAIAGYLGGAPALRDLALRLGGCSFIGAKALAYLASALQTMPALRTLTLALSGPEGVAMGPVVADSLSARPFLESAALSGLGREASDKVDEVTERTQQLDKLPAEWADDYADRFQAQ